MYSISPNHILFCRILMVNLGDVVSLAYWVVTIDSVSDVATTSCKKFFPWNRYNKDIHMSNCWPILCSVKIRGTNLPIFKNFLKVCERHTTVSWSTFKCFDSCVVCYLLFSNSVSSCLPINFFFLLAHGFSFSSLGLSNFSSLDLTKFWAYRSGKLFELRSGKLFELADKVFKLRSKKISSLDLEDFLSLDLTNFSRLDLANFLSLDLTKFSSLDLINFSSLDLTNFSTLDLANFSNVVPTKFSSLDLANFSSLDLPSYQVHSRITISLYAWFWITCFTFS